MRMKGEDTLVCMEEKRETTPSTEMRVPGLTRSTRYLSCMRWYDMLCIMYGLLCMGYGVYACPENGVWWKTAWYMMHDVQCLTHSICR
ncbi:hypothetical protein EON65_12195 [archaeon]|nr:MAG: hypothetical protein EON65_12195 [archaeon]